MWLKTFINKNYYNTYYKELSILDYYDWIFKRNIPKGTDFQKELFYEPTSDKVVIKINIPESMISENKTIVNFFYPIYVERGCVYTEAELIEKYKSLKEKYNLKLNYFKDNFYDGKYFIFNKKLFKIKSHNDIKVLILSFGSVIDLLKQIKKCYEYTDKKYNRKNKKSFELEIIKRLETCIKELNNFSSMDESKINYIFNNCNIEPVNEKKILWTTLFYNLNEDKNLIEQIKNYESKDWFKKGFLNNKLK